MTAEVLPVSLTFIFSSHWRDCLQVFAQASTRVHAAHVSTFIHFDRIKRTHPTAHAQFDLKHTQSTWCEISEQISVFLAEEQVFPHPVNEIATALDHKNISLRQNIIRQNNKVTCCVWNASVIVKVLAYFSGCVCVCVSVVLMLRIALKWLFGLPNVLSGFSDLMLNLFPSTAGDCF